MARFWLFCVVEVALAHQYNSISMQYNILELEDKSSTFTGRAGSHESECVVSGRRGGGVLFCVLNWRHADCFLFSQLWYEKEQVCCLCDEVQWVSKLHQTSVNVCMLWEWAKYVPAQTICRPWCLFHLCNHVNLAWILSSMHSQLSSAVPPSQQA